MREMPKYKCHKEVWALKIKNITRERNPDGKIHLVFEEPGYAPLEISAVWHAKHEPQPGGYYVQYENGYTSYSPAKAFEDGYTLIK